MKLQWGMWWGGFFVGASLALTAIWLGVMAVGL